jgi:hypothetical protein
MRLYRFSGHFGAKKYGRYFTWPIYSFTLGRLSGYFKSRGVKKQD